MSYRVKPCQAMDNLTSMHEYAFKTCNCKTLLQWEQSEISDCPDPLPPSEHFKELLHIAILNNCNNNHHHYHHYLKLHLCKFYDRKMCLWIYHNIWMNLHRRCYKIGFYLKKNPYQSVFSLCSFFLMQYEFENATHFCHCKEILPNSVEQVQGKVDVVLKNVFFCVFLSIWTFHWSCQEMAVYWFARFEFILQENNGYLLNQSLQKMCNHKNKRWVGDVA